MYMWKYFLSKIWSFLIIPKYYFFMLLIFDILKLQRIHTELYKII